MGYSAQMVTLIDCEILQRNSGENSASKTREKRRFLGVVAKIIDCLGVSRVCHSLGTAIFLGTPPARDLITNGIEGLGRRNSARRVRRDGHHNVPGRYLRAGACNESHWTLCAHRKVANERTEPLAAGSAAENPRKMGRIRK